MHQNGFKVVDYHSGAQASYVICWALPSNRMGLGQAAGSCPAVIQGLGLLCELLGASCMSCGALTVEERLQEWAAQSMLSPLPLLHTVVKEGIQLISDEYCAELCKVCMIKARKTTGHGNLQ